MTTPVGRLVARFGTEVDDADEETFLLFAHDRPPAQNLGFVDPHAAVLDLAVAGRDLTIHQSPAVLTSNRAGGTTGAVLWNITPRVAEWLAQPDNVFFRELDGGDDGDEDKSRNKGPVLGPQSALLELGCGISAVIGLVLTRASSQSGGNLAPATFTTTGPATRKKTRMAAKAARTSALPPRSTNTVARYIMTDQPYVAKLVQLNLEENAAGPRTTKRSGTSTAASSSSSSSSLVYFRPLDWETDRVTLDHLLNSEDAASAGGTAAVSGASSDAPSPLPPAFDAVLACDCIYNDALVAPLVQTCVDACRLRTTAASSLPLPSPPSPTVCIVAQQLREPEVLTAWLAAFHAAFRVWRVPADELPPALQPSAGFAVHVGILREDV